MKKISIIIPIYNCVDYLNRCLNSIINNTYKNLEIICINDGSTDNCLSVLKEFASRDKRFVIIDQKNAGVSQARNVGLLKASGDYISFIDADDYIHAQYFEFLLNAIQENNADIAVSNYKVTYTSENNSALHEQVPAFNQLNYSHLRPPHTLRSYIWGKLYKKSLLDNRYFDSNLKLYEDKDFAISLLCDFSSLKIVATSLPLYYYYMRENSATKIFDNMFALQSLNHMLTKAKEQKNNTLFYDEIFRHSMSIYENEFHQSNRASETLKKAKDLMYLSYLELKKSPYFDIKHKFIYSILSHFPFIYHIVYSIYKKTRRKK